MKSDKQHFFEPGSKQKSLERDEKARIDNRAAPSKAQMGKWDHLKQHPHKPEATDTIGQAHSDKKGLKRPL